MNLGRNLACFVLIIILSFALPRIIPGNPLSLAEGDMHILNMNLPEDTYNVFKEYYAPEKTLGEQFIIYIRHLSKLDLGYSFYYRMPVSRLIAGRIGWTIFLSISSIVISSLIGIPLGLNRAIKKKKTDNLILGFFSSIQALPSFLVAILFQLIFCFRIKIFPSSGAYTPGMDPFSEGFIKDVLFHSTVPLMTLVFLEVPSIFLLVYNTTSNIKDENYVKTAYYLNIDEKRIKYDYILHNSLPEILSKINIQFLYAISGTLFVESVFSYPGMGSLLKVATTSSDYPLLQGILLVVGIYGLIVNMVFKLLIKKVNPRF